METHEEATVYTPREVNEMAARLRYMPCSVCGAFTDFWWEGQGHGGPLFIWAGEWDTPAISFFCKQHLRTEASLQ